MSRPTYQQAHSAIRRSRGRASDQSCDRCDGQAADWAYAYPADAVPLVDPAGRPYSADPRDYVPLCRSCHRRHDLDRDPRLREIAETVGQANSAALLAARRADPELDARLRAASSRNIALGTNFRDDPLHQRRAQRAAQARRAELRRDPDSLVSRTLRTNGLRAGRANAVKMNAVRRRCDECGLDTNAGNLGRHQQRSGHTGWTERRISS